MANTRRIDEKTYHSPFAENLRAIMEERGDDQVKLGKKIGVSQQSISQYMSGVTSPRLETAQRIADLYGVSLDYLSGRSRVKSDEPEKQTAHKYTGLSEDALSVLQEYKEKGLSRTSQIVSDMLTYTVNNPAYDENGVALLRAMGNILKVLSFDIVSETEKMGYLWIIQDMFMSFVKDYLKENKSTLNGGGNNL